MKKAGIRSIGAVLLAVSLLSLLDPVEVAAQSPSRQTSPCCWDMWNPNWMQRHMWGPGRRGPEMRHRMTRHWTFMHQGIPAAYRGARNPFSSDAKTVSEGRALYQEKCASCHGSTGMGDGKAGRALNPSPALLAYMIQMPMAVDEYLLWSVSDGGEMFGTAMPAFKGVLTKDQIWKVIAYMRAGFPTGKFEQ